MKKALFFICTFFFAPCWGQNPTLLTVGLEKAIFRKSPDPLSRKLGTWNYGEQVKEISRKGPWIEAEKDGKKGWLHQSSFGSSKNILKDIGRGEQVSKDSYRDEVVTAGKGFNPEFEKMYKEKNQDLRYDLVDQVEKTKPSPEEVRTFVKNGKLTSHVMEAL